MQQSTPVLAPCGCKGSQASSLLRALRRAWLHVLGWPEGFALNACRRRFGRGLSLLSAHGTAMLCAIHGEADWGAGDLEDPLRARESELGSMSDEDNPYEIGRKTLHPELANVDKVLTNIENRELPYGAIGSFVKILVVRERRPDVYQKLPAELAKFKQGSLCNCH